MRSSNCSQLDQEPAHRLDDPSRLGAPWRGRVNLVRQHGDEYAGDDVRVEYFYAHGQSEVHPGELLTFESYHPLQRSVVPLFARVGDRMKGIGTAVCVALDCFVTARHVVARYDNGLPPELEIPFDMCIYVETGQRASSDPESMVGGLLDVTWTNAHSETDVATLTVKLNATAEKWLRPVTLALRMPHVDEPVAAFGYDHLQADGDLSGAPEDVVLTIERNLTVGVGTVLEHQLERRLSGGLHRTSPGFRTNTPTRSGMSGGPVFDVNDQVIGFNSGSTEPSGDHPVWDSFVAGTASALELSFRLPPGTQDAEEIQMIELARRGVIRCEPYETYDVDPATRSARYLDPGPLP
ncbi:MAG: serine protease [Marmoricola sp.]|nr:serine protease [Marmoricola sp.]